jgi:hypothetical protein
VDTVKIVNPNNPEDFIIIASADFAEGQPHVGHGIAAMERWDPRKSATPEPARPDGSPPEDNLPQSARLAELKTMTVAELGPKVAEETDVELLVRLLDIESRTTAKALIQDRLDELELLNEMGS